MQDVFDELCEVAPGAFKRMGDCTAEDLRNAAALLRLKGSYERDSAAAADTLVVIARWRETGRVPALVFQRLGSEEEQEPGIPGSDLGGADR